MDKSIRLVLATVPGDLCAVLFRPYLEAGVPFQTSWNTWPTLSGQVVTQTECKPTILQLGCSWTTIPTLWFLQLWLQLCFWVVILLWYDLFVDWTVQSAVGPPTFRSVIWLILVGWLWHNSKLWAILASFQMQLNKYWSDHKSDMGKLKSGSNCTINKLIMSLYDQNTNA